MSTKDLQIKMHMYKTKIVQAYLDLCRQSLSKGFFLYGMVITYIVLCSAGCTEMEALKNKIMLFDNNK